MSSRIRCRKSFKRLFECFLVLRPPPQSLSSSTDGSDNNEGEGAVIESIYPPSFNDQDVLRSALQFAFPCSTQNPTVELFTFVLTSANSKWTFGYCRHPPSSSSASARSFLFLTFLPWQEIFYRTLNYMAELEQIQSFLTQMYNASIPEAGTCLYIPSSEAEAGVKPFVCACPSDFGLPSIPENRNVSEFYNALTPSSMLILFSSLLSERRIIITSRKLSRLSSIVISCNLFLYPMSWQHIFIPILPSVLQDYLSAPMPYLIGVPLSVYNAIPAEQLGQVVRVDADQDIVSSPFPEDLEMMPEEVVGVLKKALSGGERVLGDGLSRGFLRALAMLMGHYGDAVVGDEPCDMRFDGELFTRLAHPSHRAYISEKLLRLQIFQQFIEERLDRMKNGNVESDEFELESLAWRSSRGSSSGRNGHLKSLAGQQNKALKKAGKAVMSSVKREGNHLIETVKHNSALKSAFRSVKESGKTVKQKGHVAYSDIKSKFHVSIPISSSNHQSSFNNQTSNHTQLNKLQLPTSTQNQQQSDSLVLSNSISASHLPRFNNNNASSSEQLPKVAPRLSKSEENLIDLDTPGGGGLGFTLENPLYELVNGSSGSVFEKSDDQLMAEYGLDEYFKDMDLSSSVERNGSSDYGFSNKLLDTSVSSSKLDSSGSLKLNLNSSPSSFGSSPQLFNLPLKPPRAHHQLGKVKLDLSSSEFSNGSNSERRSGQDWTTFE